MKQKILIKVIDKDSWKWIHLCYIDSRVYQKFKDLFTDESLTIGSHISEWLLQDFNVRLSMSYKRDVLLLKNILHTWYRHEYPELYIKSCPGDRNRISGLTEIWMTQHMQYEIEKRKEGIK